VVIEYKPDNDEWINRISNCVRYILEESQQRVHERRLYGVDLVVICALAKPELEELLKLPWNWSSPRPISDLIFVYDGYFVSDGRRITVCATAATRVGMVSTAIVSAAVIELLRPKVLAMCGICAGVRGRTQIGDVLLADPSWDFQSGKRVRKNDIARFAIAPHQLHPPELVRSHVDQIRMDEDSLERIAGSFGEPAPNQLRVLIGPIATGSPVVADGQIVEEIKAQHRELIGIEMEIYGLYAAAHSASAPRPVAFALKGVCDFADPSKNDDYQRYAAYASANVLRVLMERFGTRLLMSG
jgi:nucleoside phosphorylase